MTTGHIRIDHTVIRSGWLAGAGKALPLYLILLSHADIHGECWPGTKKLREECGGVETPTPDRTLRTWRNILTELGFIKSRTETDGDSPIHYKIALPGEALTPRPLSDGVQKRTVSEKCMTPRPKTATKEEPVKEYSSSTPREGFEIPPSGLTDKQRHTIEDMIKHDLRLEIGGWFPDTSDDIRQHIMAVCETDTECQSYTRRKPTTVWKNALRKLHKATPADRIAALAHHRRIAEEAGSSNPAAHLGRIIDKRAWDTKGNGSKPSRKTVGSDASKMDLSEDAYFKRIKDLEDQGINTEEFG